MDLHCCFHSKSLGNRIRRTINRNSNIITTMDLANWMGKLDDSKRDTSINLLAIPGSHDAMTYAISRSSTISPDAEPIVKQLAKYLRPFVKLIMHGWSVTQSNNVMKQLNMGIRYLDLRIATKEKDRNFYFVHGMYGNSINSGLSDIAKFLNSHAKEVVILDFQHFYSFKYSDHQRLVDQINKVFGQKLCPRPSSVKTVTLNWMMENKYQVIAIYRNSHAKDVPTLWTSNMWLTPWPDTMNESELLKYLERHLAERPQDVGYVSQCVLTPQTSTIVKSPFSGIKKKCATPVSKTIIPWIKKRSPPLNVAIADFVGMNKANFPSTVVSLNYS